MPKDNEMYNEIYESLLKTQPQLTTSQRRKFAKTMLASRRKKAKMPPEQVKMLVHPTSDDWRERAGLKRLGENIEEGNLKQLASLPDYDTRDKEGE